VVVNLRRMGGRCLNAEAFSKDFSWPKKQKKPGKPGRKKKKKKKKKPGRIKKLEKKHSKKAKKAKKAAGKKGQGLGQGGLAEVYFFIGVLGVRLELWNGVITTILVYK
jgi:hypothetical protein